MSKSYGGVRALKGVSFDLRPGEVHALLGENGAGKSTLIKVVTGAHQPDGGTIEIAGQPVRHLTPAAARELGIACIYQQPALFPDLTVAENIALRLEPVTAGRRVDWPARHARAGQLLQRIGAEISPDAEVRSLSMPEQQLVEIACALGAGARVVIMDEPTASLTQKEVQLLFGVVRDLQGSGVGVIYITHRLEEIFAVADRVTVLRNGESVGTYPVQEVNEASLIKLMVGREVSTIYPPVRLRPRRSRPIAEKPRLRSRRRPKRDSRSARRRNRRPRRTCRRGTHGARPRLFGITPADSGEIILSGSASPFVRRRKPLRTVSPTCRKTAAVTA